MRFDKSTVIQEKLEDVSQMYLVLFTTLKFLELFIISEEFSTHFLRELCLINVVQYYVNRIKHAPFTHTPHPYPIRFFILAMVLYIYFKLILTLGDNW